MRYLFVCLSIFIACGLLRAQSTEGEFLLVNIDVASDPAIPNQFVVAWDMVDPMTETFVPYTPEDDYTASVTVSATVQGDLLQIEGTTSANTISLEGVLPESEEGYAVAIVLEDEFGSVIASGFVQGVTPLRNNLTEPVQQDCDKILADLFEQKEICEKDTSELEAAYQAALEAADAAEEAMNQERARRAEQRSIIAEAARKRNQLFNQLDDLNADKTDLEDALFDKAKEYWTEERGGPAEFFLQGPPPDPAEEYITVDLGQGVSLYFSRSQYSPGEAARYSSIAQRQFDGDWAWRNEYEDIQDAIQATCDDIAETQEAIAECDAIINAAVASGNHQGPADTEYRAAIAALEEAREALAACLLEKQIACDRAEKLAEALERCERENAIAMDLNDAIGDGEEAENDIREAEEALGGVPEGVRGSGSRADRDAGEAETCQDEAEALLAEARQAAAEAKAALDAGDLDTAETKAAEAKMKAAQAKAKAAAAASSAATAKTNGIDEAADAVEEALAQRERELRNLNEWQCKREACIDYIVSQVVNDIEGDLTLAELEELKSALADVISLSSDADTAMDLIQASGAATDDVKAVLQSVQGKLRAAIGRLNQLQDKIDGLTGTIEELVNLKANLDALLNAPDPNSPDAARDRARQFGAWLNLLSTGLDKTISKLPFAQIITGYLTFLIDGYNAALEAIDEIQRDIIESRIDDYVNRRGCGFYLARLKEMQAEGGTIQDLIDDFIADARADEDVQLIFSDNDNALQSQNFEIVTAQLVLERLARCCDDQLESEAPEITYSEWLDGFNGGGGVQAAAAIGILAVTDPAEDTSGDGVPNFVKYFFNQDPNAMAPAPFRIEVVDFGPDAYALVFSRIRGLTDVEYVVEQSPTLGDGETWTLVTGLEEFYPDPESGIDEVYVFPRATEDPGLIDPTQFYRIRFVFTENE